MLSQDVSDYLPARAVTRRNYSSQGLPFHAIVTTQQASALLYAHLVLILVQANQVHADTKSLPPRTR